MFSFKGFKIVNLINKALSPFSHKKAAANNEDDQQFVLEKGNPWQENLQRLATEHKFNFEKISQSEDLSTFVADLSKAANEAESQKKPHVTAEQTVPKGARARAGDRTINDMKSWWQQSLSPANDSEMNLRELPGKPRLLKRWFE